MWNKLIEHFLGEELDARIRAYFVQGSFKSLFFQIAISLLTFLTSIVVARLTGDEGFGIYSLVLGWLSILSVGAMFGLDDLALKQIPIYQDEEQPAALKGLLRWSHQRALVVSLLMMTLYLLLVNCTHIPGLYEYATYHNYAALSIPFFVLMHLNQAALRAAGKLGRGQMAEKLVQPLAFFLLLGGAFLLGWQVSDLDAIIYRVIAMVLAAAAAIGLLLWHFRPLWKGLKTQLPANAKHWQKSCFFFMLASLLYMANTRIDLLFLGIYELPPEKIAYYNVAAKFADLSMVPFLILSTVVTPMFSSLFHQAKLKELQTFYTKTTRLTAIVVTLILILFISLGPWFLAIYGENFQEGYGVLVLLCITKFVHVFVGPVSYLLMMIGEERAVTWALGASVALTLILLVVLIPLWGIEGAALATLGGLLLYDMVVGRIAFVKTGIWVTALGRWK